MIGYIIIGMLAGFVASKIYKKEGSGCLVNLLLGIVGGWVSGMVLGWIGLTPTGSLGNFAVSVIGAVIVLWLWNKLR